MSPSGGDPLDLQIADDVTDHGPASSEVHSTAPRLWAGFSAATDAARIARTASAWLQLRSVGSHLPIQP